MNTVTEHIREHLLSQCGIPTKPDPFEAGKVPGPDELRRTECDQETFDLADNRMVQGYFRYGSANGQGFDKYDYIGEAHRRLDRYNVTRNRENLIDAINIIRLANVHAKKRGDPFESVDDGEHNQRID